MNVLIKTLVLSSSLLATACVYPTSAVVQGGNESAIYFEAFPVNSAVFIDGQSMGYTENFDGVANTLAVAEGSHTVIVRHNGHVLHEKMVFVGRNSVLKISK